MNYLVDSNVFSEATRPAPNAKVLGWLEKYDTELYVSALTLAELSKGIHLLPAGVKRRKLEAWFEELAEGFAGRILPVDEFVARKWGTYYTTHQRQGRSLSSFDSLLAATALAHNLTIATRNAGDFPADVPVVNPWQ